MEDGSLLVRLFDLLHSRENEKSFSPATTTSKSGTL